MTEARARILAAAALLGIALLLLFVQLHVFPELKLEVAARGLPPSAGSVLSVLRSDQRVDHVLPLALTVLLALALLVLEPRARGVSSLLERATAIRIKMIGTGS